MLPTPLGSIPDSKAPYEKTSRLIKNHQPEIWAIKHPKYKFLKVFLSLDICTDENHISNNNPY
jgi:hypothetical protein